MAKRNRFSELESKMTRILLVNTAVFVLFLIFSAFGIIPMKVISAIVSILVSFLCLSYLYMSGEMRKRRSLWMLTASAGLFLCTVVSLICNFPSPAA